MNRDSSIEPLNLEAELQQRTMWKWAAAVTLMCLFPLLTMLVGVDFSSHHAPLNADLVADMTIAQLGDAAHQALRGSFTHTLLEWTAFCAAMFVLVLAVVQFRLTREPSLPIIGMALACSGAMDAFHALAADRLIHAVADNRDLIPFTWAICRMFNAVIMLVGVGIFAYSKRKAFTHRTSGFVLGISACFVAVAYVIIHFCATSNFLPQTMFPDSVIKRPYDLFPILPYLLCGLVVYPRYLRRHRSIFGYTLVLALIPHIATQLYMAFGSFRLHDSCFNVAHGLKAVSYLVPLLGLVLEYMHTYRERKRTERLLRQRARQALLLNQANEAAAQATSVQEALQACIDLVCESFAWPIGHAYVVSEDGCDELESSAAWHLADKQAFAPFVTLTERTRFRPTEGLPGKVMRSAEAVWIVDVRKDENFLRAEVCSDLGIRGALGFPVRIKGQTAAVLEFFTHEAMEPDEELLQTMTVLGQQLGGMFERRETARRLLDSNDQLEALASSLDAARQDAETRAHELECQKLAMDEHAIVAITDPSGRISYANDRFCQLSQYSKEELIGQDHRIVNSGHHPPEFFAELWKTISSGKVWHGEVCNRAKDGSLYWVDTTIVPFRDEAGGILQYVAIRTDITERKQDELELEATMNELALAKQLADEANSCKSEFLANMSHEIRTPMTAILGFAENMLDTDQSESEKLNCVHTIRRNGEYLLGIINDILDLSKIEAGKMTMEHRDCRPCGIIAEVASLVRVRATAKGLPFKIEYIGAIPETIHSDPTRLRQILINLIGNAIKFTEVGSVRLVTRLVDDGDAPRLQFDVIDTGRGMTPEQVGNLYQPFTQADNSTTRKFGGTGLGLTISRRFAELLGGDIIVTATEPGVGTTFRATVTTGPLEGVTLLEDALSATVVSETTGVIAQSPRSGLQGLHILLAEDGPDNQRLIAFFLKKAGAEVTVEENGKLALDAALAARDEGNPFDVILMDMQMPVMDGYQATRQLRLNGYTAPIIALTAHAMDSDRKKCIDAGCDDYATKPIDRKKLIEMIQRHVMPDQAVVAERQTNGVLNG